MLSARFSITLRPSGFRTAKKSWQFYCLVSIWRHNLYCPTWWARSLIRTHKWRPHIWLWTWTWYAALINRKALLITRSQTTSSTVRFCSVSFGFLTKFSGHGFGGRGAVGKPAHLRNKGWSSLKKRLLYSKQPTVLLTFYRRELRRACSKEQRVN